MGRSPCCDKMGVKKGPWAAEEDKKLVAYIQEHGHGSWRALPPKAGLQRCGKSCRLRWTNYLSPDIKRGKFSLEEEQTIIQLHALLGNRWSAIASHLPKRTDNEINNHWNTHLKKRLTEMGIDPTTHRPKCHAFGSARPKEIANLIHMAQWETARLEAESRSISNSSARFHSLIANKTFAQGPGPGPGPGPSRLPCLDILKVWQGFRGKKVFFSEAHKLESPTSILNFSDKVVTNGDGPSHESSSLLDNSNYGWAEQLKGVMGNSPMPLHEVRDHDVVLDCWSIDWFPSLSEKDVFVEDNYTINYNYWGNISNDVS